MKSYTDIEQSKKLAEILPLESADMSWVSNGLGKPFARTISIKGNPEELCACWSLAALLNILTSIDAEQVRLVGFKNYWYCEPIFSDVNHYIGFIDSDNPVDACYEMILKLHEQKLL